MKRLAPVMVMLLAAASPLYAGTIRVTPEPATIGLMAAGLGALGVGAWLRSRKGR